MDTIQKNKTLLRIGYTALLIIVAASVTAQAAPVLGTPQNSVSAGASGGNLAVGDTCGGPVVSGSTVVSYGCSVGTGAPTAFAANAGGSAGLGVVHVSTSAYALAITDTYGSNANANVSMTDYIAISGPANSSGLLHGSFILSGNLAAGVSGAPEAVTAAGSSYSIQTSFAGINGGRDGGWTLATNGTDIQSNVSGAVLPVDATIYFGSDGWASVSLSILAQLNSNGTARAYKPCSTCPSTPGEFLTSANFGNTIYWGGISSITVNGAPLTDYQLISASGADYRYATSPVPVPAAAWLLGSGLLGLIGLARRKRK